MTTAVAVSLMISRVRRFTSSNQSSSLGRAASGYPYGPRASPAGGDEIAGDCRLGSSGGESLPSLEGQLLAFSRRLGIQYRVRERRRHLGRDEVPRLLHLTDLVAAVRPLDAAHAQPT